MTEPNSEWHPVVTVPRTEPFWSQFHNPLHINDVGGWVTCQRQAAIRLSKWPRIGLKAQLSPTSRHEQNFAGGHVRGVLLQSARGLLQRKFSLEFGFEVASQ